MMRLLLVMGTSLIALGADTDSSAGKLWTELQTKREQLTAVHQEFDVTRTFKFTNHTQGSKWQIILDLSQRQWRERSVTGSGSRVKLFDGTDLFMMEEGGDEYVRVKRRPKDPDPAPSPYTLKDADWSKSQELQRRPCGLPGKDDPCVVLEVRLKPSTKVTGASATTSSSGAAQIFLDLQTGLVVAMRIVEAFQPARSAAYQSQTDYVLKRTSFDPQSETTLFKMPSDLREVKQLSKWNAGKIRKQLAGKPAPEFTVTDIQGKTVTLSAFKGKTVLLDFWTTWCPPCRKDGPALDKLYQKYGEKSLIIVGISVSEDRSVVEKYLTEHPHAYPIVLSSENDFPNEYRIELLPTYIVIEPDGTLVSAVEGDQGFSDLRKLLKKAGLDTE
jgi:thiol-disulfide isomerase/thioredoxin